MNLYFVADVGHGVFVQANTPRDALDKAVFKKEISYFLCATVSGAQWIDGILTPIAPTLLEITDED